MLLHGTCAAADIPAIQPMWHPLGRVVVSSLRSNRRTRAARCACPALTKANTRARPRPLARAAALAPGTVLDGRYTIEGQLGAGANAITYRARVNDSGEQVRWHKCCLLGCWAWHLRGLRRAQWSRNTAHVPRHAR